MTVYHQVGRKHVCRSGCIKKESELVPRKYILQVVSWVLVSGLMSYARMWVYGWARRGGARGMRACGAATQVGSAIGSLVFFFIVNIAQAFRQPDACPTPAH